ncbi:MAG: hypothetical protein GY765_08295, partial [bacterium]|nr:hypothetical protein [bacterium]
MKNIPYKNFSSFILRSPLLPFNFLDPLTTNTKTSEEQLKEMCGLPVVQEAIFLASPDLYAPLQQWLKGELKDKKKFERLKYGVMRYLLRMSTRPTPFGLFAGFSIGEWDISGEDGEVELPEQSKYERHTRMDMNYLCALAQDLAKHPIIKESILYYPNSSIYPVGDQLRYVEFRYLNSKRTHHIVAVDHTDYLQSILDMASGGAYLKDLAQSLVDDEITIEEARGFIEDLIESQVLVHQLEPAITGPEFLDQITSVLDTIEGIDDIKNFIGQIKTALHKIDTSQIGTTVDNYHQIAEALKPLGTGFELKFLFQTDMVKPTVKCTLEGSVVRDILEGFEMINRLSPKQGTTNLTQFRDAFHERYETREMPLLQALDTESGVGYRQTGHAGDIAPLVDDLAIPGTAEAGNDVKWNRVQSFLFQKYKESLLEDKYEVEITAKELEGFTSEWSDLPDSFSAMVQVVSEKTETAKKVISVSGFGGSSAGNLLGRFCHADVPTDTFVKEMAQTEKELNPNVLLAEI